MKKLFFFSLTLLTVHASATVITVSNNPDSPAEYTDLQTTLNLMDPGDTIILSGSPTSYGSVTANRTLVLIGPGWNPQSGFNARVETMIIQGASHNSVISGIEMNNLETKGSFDNVTVTKCRFTTTAHAIWFPDHDNCQVYGNVVDGGHITINENSENCLISNNVIRYQYSGFNGILHGGNKSTLFLNNIIYSSSDHILFPAGSGVFIANNVFIMTNSTLSADPNEGCSGCNYNNNITYSTFNIDIPDLPGPGNYGGNNWNDVDPEFVFLPNDASNFSVDHDYHLSGDSPGQNAGTDGTDVGIYGRIYDFNQYGHTDIPRIHFMNIENPVVLVDSSLHVVVKGTTTK